VSEFYPTTLATFYTTFVPRDDYDTPDSGDNETVAATGVPIQILTNRVMQGQPVDMDSVTSKTYSGRVRGHVHIDLNYRILDEWSGERYSIDEIDKAQNPLGDDSWVLKLRKIPKTSGQ
jgi:hypothetical protein